MARERERRGEHARGLSRAHILDLCARFAAYAEAGSTQKDLLAQAGRDAMERFPADAEVHVAVGRMYLLAEELPDAEHALRLAANLAPRDPHALRLLGEVLLRLGDAPAAHTALSSAVANGMNDPWTKTWVARALDYADLLTDLGPEGIARDVRQVLGRPGQGPPDEERRSNVPLSAEPNAASPPKGGVIGKIDQGVYFAGDPRAEPPEMRSRRFRFGPGEIVDLPTPAPGGTRRADPETTEPLAGALAEDSAWGQAPPSSDSMDSMPGSKTEVSAWVPPEIEQLREQQKHAGRRSAPPPVKLESAGGAPSPQIAASELFDEFTDHKRPRASVPQATDDPRREQALAITAEKPRRGPPPLPAEPGRAGPPPLPVERGLSPLERPIGPVITVIGDEPGPMTAPPSALIPMDGGPVTAPPSALISMENGPVTAPPSALIPMDEKGAVSRAPREAAFPPEPPSLQIPSALLVGSSSLEASAPATAANNEAVAPKKAQPSKPPSRLQSVLLRALAALAVVAVLAGGFELYKRNRATKIRAFSAQAATALQAGGPRGVADAEAALASARRIDPKSRALALASVKVRFFAVLDVDAARLPDLVSAIEEASNAGLRSGDLAFAQVARAIASNDGTTAVEMIAHHDEDPDRAADALYQLAAGAAVEAHDPGIAVDRYRAAVQLEPQLISAQVRLVRALALAGQSTAAKEALSVVKERTPDRPELSVLDALIAVFGPARPDPLPTIDTDPDMLPRPLRAIARAFAKSGDEKAIAQATAEADVAPLVVLCGELALRDGHEAQARDAAHRALEQMASYAPAFALAARVALLSGRYEEARQAALRAPPEVASEMLALIAYEAGNLAAMTEAAGARANDPITSVLSAGLSRLRAVEPISPTALASLAKSGKLWADIVAMDAALDAGELDLAQTIATGWGASADKHPVRAARIARLLRYQGKNGLAQAAASSAVPVTAARVEGALAAAEMASARVTAATAMASGRTDEERWVAVFLLAREARDGPARTLMRGLAYPGPDASLQLRTVATLALAELRIPKNPTHQALFTSLEAWTQNPDVARGLGVPRKSPGAAASDAPPKPVLRGRLPRKDDELY